ncbi:MAG: rubredoxin [Bacteroidetes bacterium]|nr:rubredoxin [Bacteroidota bacterium]
MTYRYYRKTRKAASPKNSPTYQAKDKLTPSDDKSGQQCWLCPSCGYIYDPAEGDPDSGIAPGTSYKELPNDWICPVCGISKESFIPYD